VASDNELVGKFLSGDRTAFDELVIRHQKQVYSIAYRMVRRAETAEEIAQETFIRAFRSLRSFRQKASLNTWLYRITMNLCCDELKRRPNEVELDPETPGANTADYPPEKMAEEERKEWLERQIDALPFKQKSAVVLRIFQGMSFREIGHAIGCSTGSAKVNYRHALLKLKDARANLYEEL